MKGEGVSEMSFVTKTFMTTPSLSVPSFNYPTTTWAAKRAYAHFGTSIGRGPIGVNG